YEAFEFHTIYHSVHNFCTVDLSSFYLDVVKDRLYTRGAGSRARRAAQTTIYHVLDHLVRLTAPVLVFTSDEAWGFMPGGREESVHLAAFPEPREEWLDEGLDAKWARLAVIKSEISKALEGARTRKIIGHPLDARVTVYPPSGDAGLVEEEKEALEEILIVSRLDVSEGGPAPAGTGTGPEHAYTSAEIEGLRVTVARAPGEKCERCWHYSPSVGSSAEHATVCSRCLEALR
ncbi:MAG: class I tRNA ligase family protein, partial [Thermodesulfobacteriota bacterium]